MGYVFFFFLAQILNVLITIYKSIYYCFLAIGFDKRIYKDGPHIFKRFFIIF